MGDKSFEEYLGKLGDGKSPPAPFFIMVTIMHKLEGIQKMYQITADALAHCSNEHTRDCLEKFLVSLMEKSSLTLEQFDWLIADFVEDDEDDEEGGPDGI